MKEKSEARTTGSAGTSARKSPGGAAAPPAQKRGKLDPVLLFQAGLAVTVLAMSLIVLGVIAGSLFLPGIYVLIVGMLLIALAGILYVLPSAAESARA